MQELTPNGVPFDWWLVNINGAGFCLLPVKGYHTDQDVEEAKRHLRSDRDVVALRVSWQDPGPLETREYLEAQTAIAAGPPEDLLRELGYIKP